MMCEGVTNSGSGDGTGVGSCDGGDSSGESPRRWEELLEVSWYYWMW